MTTIKDKFLELKKKKEKALIGFVTGGDPNPDLSVEIVIAMAESGVDIIELGIPFSDPTADGPVIQEASSRAIQSGTNIDTVFEMTKKIKSKTDTPLVLFTYYNPVLKYGEDRFCKKAVDCGANGILIVDLPFEESSMINDYDRDKFPRINLTAPTTSNRRMKEIAGSSSGFVYLVSKTGITGSSGLDPEMTKKDFFRLKKDTDIPVCVGFGIKTEDDVKNISEFADGVVIGSAFESLIHENLKSGDLPEILGRRAGEYKRNTFIL